MKHFMLLLFLSLVFVPSAHSKLSGKNVVYLHGLQFDAIFEDGTQANVAIWKQRARDEAEDVAAGLIEEVIGYDSGRRLHENEPYLIAQLQEIRAKRTCQSGCIFVTASTGDLVARYILMNKQRWGFDDIKVLLSIDLVGAGGGTEVADLAVSLLEGHWVGQLFAHGLLSVFRGNFFHSRSEGPTGMGYELRPSVARNTHYRDIDVPRLRLAGAGHQWYIPTVGRNDGLVPIHSACGARYQLPYESCNNNINYDGRIRSLAIGPSSRFLYPYHYPIFMGTSMGHGETTYSGPMVAINNGISKEGVTFQVNEKTRATGWWIFKKYYRTIDKPSNMTAAQFFVQEFR